VLDTGLPIALYQLPQVTENEMTPQCVAELAARYSNFYLFKDSSGHDRVAQSGLDFADVFLVRGAEGQYDRWLKSAAGPYAGFLLSTANCFAKELAELQHLLQQGKPEEAGALSRRLEAVIDPCFRMVECFSAGNALTNANKVLDHIFAYGADATKHKPPLLYSGLGLPARFVETAIGLLDAQRLLPTRGYLG
jgi:dihydrodipicolinate synthase/N-acetylneuraminate lyase